MPLLMIYHRVLDLALAVPLMLLPGFKESAFQVAQGGHQCSDRVAGDVLGDAQQAKRVRTVGQVPRS